MSARLSLGVEIKFEHDVSDIGAATREADLVVAADGINSRVRETFADQFKPSVDLRPNKFAWMGSTRPFDAFTFFFRETEFGIFIAHCYQYEPGRSTWVMETDPQTFARAGLDKLDEAASAKFLENVFAEELQRPPPDHQPVDLAQFPDDPLRALDGRQRRAARRRQGDRAFFHRLGHQARDGRRDLRSIEAFRKTGGTNVKATLQAFETQRREEVEKTQHSADVSLVWFEHVKRFWDMDPTRFAFGLMTRSRAITYDNLALRAPEFVREVDTLVARETKARGFDVEHGNARRSDVSAAPAARHDARQSRRRLADVPVFRARTVCRTTGISCITAAARSAAPGLLFTEMTCVSAQARITPGCTGMYSDAQEAAWKRIADFVHANSAAKFCLQLGHSGRKGATKLMWEGMDEPLPSGAWPIVSASPLPYFPDSQIPREMTRADMDKVIADFVQAVQRGVRAGFDMIELHAAHGYLLASFISPLTNQRKDEYGGALENRMRFPLEVFRAMRAAWPESKPMSVRISATDWQEGGLTGEESVAVARMFAQAGCDLIDVSTGQTTPEAEPVYGRMFQTPFSDQIRNEAKLATMCVGNITTADQVNTIIAAGRADLVALARPHLVDPFFTMKAAAWYAAAGLHCPPQYLPGKEQIFRNAARDRDELTTLKRKSKPKAHADTWKQAAE